MSAWARCERAIAARLDAASQLVGSHGIKPEDVDGYELALQAVKRVRRGSTWEAEMASMEASVKAAEETNDGYAGGAYKTAIFAMRSANGGAQ